MSEAIFEQDSKGEENAASNEEKGSAEEGKQKTGSIEEEAGSEAGGKGVGEAPDQTETDRTAQEAGFEETSEEEKKTSEEEKISEQEVKTDKKEKIDILEVSDETLLTDKYLEEAAADYTEQGYTKEQAQWAISRESKLAESMYKTGVDDAQADAEKELKEASARWDEELANDPELGGDKATETKELAKRLLDQYFPENHRKWLDKSGLSKMLVKSLRNIAVDLQMGDDVVERGGNVGQKKKKSDTELFYPES